MFALTVISSLLPIFVFSQDCELNLFDKSVCCEGVFNASVTEAIGNALASYPNSSESAVYTSSASHECQYYICQYQWAGNVFDCSDRFQNLLLKPAHDFIQNYIMSDWAKSVASEVEEICMAKMRQKYFEDIDNNVFDCSSQAYHFTECLYDTFNEMCPQSNIIPECSEYISSYNIIF